MQNFMSIGCIVSKEGGREVRLIPPPPLKCSCNYFMFEASGVKIIITTTIQGRDKTKNKMANLYSVPQLFVPGGTELRFRLCSFFIFRVAC